MPLFDAMNKGPDNVWLAGVDGCPDGWVAVFVRPNGEAQAPRIFKKFAEIISAPQQPMIVAVDIPIGLPKSGGREAELAARSRLGKLKSSVFPIPSRAAIFAEPGPFASQVVKIAAHRRACVIAEATSNPPRRIVFQAFGIFPKIREVDTVLRRDPSLESRVFETHPELAFWRLNGDQPLTEKKKIKGKLHPAGIDLRQKLLVMAGLPEAIVCGAVPKGAARDDLLDALVCAAIARRIYTGEAEPFPNPPPRDDHNLCMAIWA